MTRLMLLIKPLWITSLLIGIASLLLPQPVHAQSLSSGISSGLFHPRSSEQFFLDGLEQFEAEIQRFYEPDRGGLTADHLLGVDDRLQEFQDELLQREQWRSNNKPPSETLIRYRRKDVR